MITLVGISHTTAPLAVRERFALSPAGAARLLAALPGEALALSTCNRTEVYGTDDAQTLRTGLLRVTGGPGDAPLSALHGPDAVRHLFAVAAGLDSMVLGEPQVLGQVRLAVEAARRVEKLGPVLDRLGRWALAAGRRVRRETPLGRGRPSIPRVAVDVARATLGGLGGRTLLVVGAGKVGGLTATALERDGTARVVVTNRTLGAAQALARAIGGSAAPLEALDALLRDADVVITCTGAPEPFLDAPRVARALAARTTPRLLLDLAVPRDVASEVRDLAGVRLFDLDDLRAAATAAVPPDVVRQAEAIVAEEAAAFVAWLAGRRAVPTIQALRARAEAILEEEIAHTPAADPERMRAFGRRLLNKLLHHPLVRMRERAAAEGSAYLDVARDLFALDGDRDGG